jgi:methyl-accepting chemotaxis protein
MSLRAKMAMPVALVSALFVIILFNVWLAFNAQEESDALLTQEVLPTLEELDEGYRDLYQIIAAAKALVLDEEVNHYKNEFKDESIKVAKRINSPQKLIDSGFISNQNQAEMRKLKDNFDRWFTLYKGLFTLNGNYESYYSIHKVEMQVRFVDMRVSLKNIRTAIEDSEHRL